MKKSLKSIILLVVTVLMCTSLAACGGLKNKDVWKEATYTTDIDFGAGDTTIKVDLIAKDKDITFTIHTNCETLGDALREFNLVSGEEGPYGLYVKTVNGIRADYEKDKAYWAFEKEGQTIEVGVDEVTIADGEQYEIILVLV